MTAIEAIAAERQRQIEAEGWPPEHDDEHDKKELARAAACYAVGNLLARHAPESAERGWYSPRPIWPWSPDWWKPGNDRKNLVKAGALIVAEIERLDRAASVGRNPTGEDRADGLRAEHEHAVPKADAQPSVASPKRGPIE